jgi:hypothetical protein
MAWSEWIRSRSTATAEAQATRTPRPASRSLLWRSSRKERPSSASRDREHRRDPSNGQQPVWDGPANVDIPPMRAPLAGRRPGGAVCSGLGRPAVTTLILAASSRWDRTRRLSFHPARLGHRGAARASDPGGRPRPPRRGTSDSPRGCTSAPASTPNLGPVRTTRIERRSMQPLRHRGAFRCLNP